MTDNRQRTILLIDDDEDDRILLRRLLRGDHGRYSVAECATGADGIRLARELRPDLILLDYYLPDMTGAEFLADFHRSTQPEELTPVAILTGQEHQAVAVEVLENGAVDYLVKGTLTGPGLARAMENAIQKFAIQRELEEKRAALELRNWELEALRDELQTKLHELADAHRAKDQFMAVMSHEMRTPLNAILGYADLMDLGIGGALSDSQRVHLERIRAGGKHLLELINDVLDLTRADARKLEMDMRPVDLPRVLEEVNALLARQADSKGIELRIARECPGLPLVQADLQRLRQILINLVGNAIKFTETGGVEVRCVEAADGRVLVHVRDTGIGIAPEALRFIFTEFFQVEGALNRSHEGSGLGLAISHRLAQLMGGEITVESRVGEGSVFTLHLQAAAAGSERRDEDVAAHAARMEAAAAGARMLAQSRVSVVAFAEDEAGLRALEDRVRASVRLVWTTEADQVPELARRELASLVVLDITCARGAAWRAAHRLQEVPELSNTAVLLLPALPASDGDDAQGIDLGWVSLVPKPFTHEQLTQAVAQAASGAGADEAGAGGAREVLVVDDDADSRRVAGQFLVGAGARVRDASDGETALVMMRRHPPDVVVLDLMMPVLDGFGVLATMRADPLLSAIPVVVLSAKTLTHAEREFLSRTAVRVLQKGEHRLTDVAALVLRAVSGVRGSGGSARSERPPSDPPG